jgi:hypothetical protein
MPYAKKTPTRIAPSGAEFLEARSGEASRAGQPYGNSTRSAMPADLTDADLAAIAKLLRDTIATDRFPLSPRVRRWQAILDKLEPPAPKPELPPLKPPGTPSIVLAKKRGRRR